MKKLSRSLTMMSSSRTRIKGKYLDAIIEEIKKRAPFKMNIFEIVG